MVPINEKISKKVLGKIVKKHRILKEKTIDETALAAEISPNFLGEIERGTYNPSIKTLSKIAHALDIQLWVIIKEAEEATAEEIANEKEGVLDEE